MIERIVVDASRLGGGHCCGCELLPERQHTGPFPKRKGPHWRILAQILQRMTELLHEEIWPDRLVQAGRLCLWNLDNEGH